jgi:hypothetical protein
MNMKLLLQTKVFDREVELAVCVSTRESPQRAPARRKSPPLMIPRLTAGERRICSRDTDTEADD